MSNDRRTPEPETPTPEWEARVRQARETLDALSTAIHNGEIPVPSQKLWVEIHGCLVLSDMTWHNIATLRGRAGHPRRGPRKDS